MSDEDYRLAPFDEADLRLAPILEEETEKPIAPDIPFRRDAKLIPVVCSACHTRLYAGTNQVGLWKKCPDCFRLTLISSAEPEIVPTDEDSEPAGGYELREPEVGKRETFRIGIDYRTLDVDQGEKRTLPRHFEDDTPKLEQIFNNLLTTNEEKEEEHQAVLRERKITEEVEAVKRAAREGRLEELISSNPGDSLAARLETRRRMADAAAGKGQPLSPPPLPPQSPVLKLTPKGTGNKAMDGAALFAALDDAILEVGGKKKPLTFFTPFFAASSRPRMVVFLVCGLIGNFFGDQVRATVWRVLAELDPGQVFGVADRGHLAGSFWIGAFFCIVWLTMMFLFGISVFLETAKGKHRIDHWVPFNLDFGLSYFGWSFLMLVVSGVPGLLVYQTVCLLTPVSAAATLGILLAAQFLCFPLLFLCVIESDTFCGVWPKKTLASLSQRRGLWLRFYVDTAFVVVLPLAAIVCLYRWNPVNTELDVSRSALFLFSAVTTVLLTLSGLCPLFYFRRLGLLAADCREVLISAKRR